MNIKRSASEGSQRRPEDYRTGTAPIDAPFKGSGALSAASIAFAPGARTAWQTHPLGQTLLVTTGRDRFEREGPSRRDRGLIPVASLLALDRTDGPPGHVRLALADGGTGDERVELVTRLAFHGGWPVAGSAIPILRQAFTEANAAQPGA